MRKVYNKLSVILVMLLSLVIVFSTASLLITNVSADTAEPSQSQEQTEDESWYEITVGEDNKSISIMIDGTLGNYANMSGKDLSDIKDKLLDALKRIVIDRLLSFEQNNGKNAAARTIDLELPNLPDFDRSMLKQYEEYIKQRLSQEGELDRYLNGEYDVLIKYAVNQYLSDEKNNVEDYDAFVEKVTERVEGVVKEVIDEKYGTLLDDPNLSPDEKAEIQDQWDAAVEKNTSKTGEIVKEVSENGSADISPAEVLQAIESISVNDNELYAGGKFSLAAVKQILRSLPKPSEIAELPDDEMNLSLDIYIMTTLSDAPIDFTLTVGLKSGYSNVRSLAKFVADHIDVKVADGKYTINVKVPDEFAAVLLKASNSNVVPDNIKHALFGMLDKPANEIVDKVGDYTYEEVVNYIKDVKFHKIFSNVLNAEYISGFFKGFGINIESLTDQNIDKLLNAILDYAEKLANKQTVEGLEEFLQRYGIPGIPAELENAVQKFLNLLNKIDYERYDATEIRNFLTSEDRISSFIGKLEANYEIKSLYEAFVDYTETLFTKLPARLQNGKLINLYKDVNTLAWAGNVDIDVKKMVTKLVEAVNSNGAHDDIEAAVEAALSKIDGDLNYKINLDLTVSVPDIYKVTYKAEDEVIGTGLLPVGADVDFYANTKTVGDMEISAWRDEAGNVYSVADGAKFTMPESDLTLSAITGYNAVLTISDGAQAVELTGGVYSKNYNGGAVTLTATVEGGVGYENNNLAYQWYKFSELGEATPIENATESSYTITDVAESGEYVCYITNTFDAVNVQDPVVLKAETESANIIINKATVDLSAAKWQVTSSEGVADYDPENNEYEYTGSAYKIELTGYTLPNGLTLSYIGDNQASQEGNYEFYVQLSDTDNYKIEGLENGYDETHKITWAIIEAVTPPIPQGNLFELVIGTTTIRVRDLDNVVPKGKELIANDVTSSYTIDKFANYLEVEEGKEAVIVNVFSIAFSENYHGNFAVEIEDSAFAGKNMVMFHIHNGDTQKLTVTASGNKLSFNVSDFSDFASISIQDKVAAEESSNWWIWLLIAIIIILLIIIIILIIRLLRKENEPEDDGRPTVIIIKTEEVAEQSEEQEAEEEPVAEETPVAEEAPVPEETPVQEETAATVAEEPDETEVPMPLVAEDGSRIVYDKSFRARLSQSESSIKDYYTELKNYILSYKGVKSRVSWHFDSFNKGRTKCLKLQLRGKSMYMYIALPAAELPEKYHVKDVSDKTRYKDVPTMLKIRKPRSLKYAKQLVAILMERLGVAQGEVPNEKYRPRYRSTKSLIDMELIKVKHTRSTFAAPRNKD